ncbi:unnamed protein product [Acanthoscelides obtectus]|uniref:Uncharacterized protein n=1 Tax=Acanthoscelides obtectus TaxID=200917 RepID=A0A9P0K5A2_ACAOB|nr:unnamed protein product [Acanthoscelides obtectus]CAK1649414.1 hypothetical protein AOBTE_LOCUS16224 [Acanthoscelides obtectus]
MFALYDRMRIMLQSIKNLLMYKNLIEE